MGGCEGDMRLDKSMARKGAKAQSVSGSVIVGAVPCACPNWATMRGATVRGATTRVRPYRYGGEDV